MPWLALAATAVTTYGGVEAARLKANAQGQMAQEMGVKNAPDFRTSEAVFDNSGWNISFGSSRIDSTAEKSTSLAGATAPGSGVGQSGGGLVPALQSAFGTIDSKTAVYAGIGLLALMIWKRRKS